MWQKRLFSGFLGDFMKKTDKIDIVIPYVDGTDPEWIKLFNQYASTKIDENVNGKTRFRGQGDFFKYVFRGIDKFIPWINNVFLLVQSKSQVPAWLNQKKIKVITHENFIPEEYLPTFNSCTIEMFLWNIPELSEKFIYINDDFYALKPATADDFFTETGIKQSLKQTKIKTIYGTQCLNDFELIFGVRPETYKTVEHAFRPYIKKYMKQCFDENKASIAKSITKFRDHKNYNCYIYSLYLDKLGKRTDSTLTNTYLGASQVSYLCRQNINKYLNYDTLCINDCDPNTNVYDNAVLNSWFKEEFPIKSKYEIGGKGYVDRTPKHAVAKQQRYFLYF